MYSSSSSASLPDLVFEEGKHKRKKVRRRRLPSDQKPIGWPEFVDAIPSAPIRDQIYNNLTNEARLQLITLLKYPKHFDSIKSTSHWTHCCLTLKLDSNITKYSVF